MRRPGILMIGMLAVALAAGSVRALDNAPPASNVEINTGIWRPEKQAAYEACMALDDQMIRGAMVTSFLSMVTAAKATMAIPVNGEMVNAEIGAQCGPNCMARLAAAIQKNYPRNWQTILGVEQCMAERHATIQPIIQLEVGTVPIPAPTALEISAIAYGTEVACALDLSKWANVIGPMYGGALSAFSVPLQADMEPEADPNTEVTVHDDGAVTVDICMPGGMDADYNLVGGALGYVLHSAAVPVPAMPCGEGKIGMHFVVRATADHPTPPNLVDMVLGGEFPMRRSASSTANGDDKARTITVAGKTITIEAGWVERVHEAAARVGTSGPMCSTIVACANNGEIRSAHNYDWGLGKEFIRAMRNASANVEVNRGYGLPPIIQKILGLAPWHKTSSVVLSDGVNNAVSSIYATAMNSLETYGRMPSQVMLALVEADLHATWDSPIPHPHPITFSAQWVMEHAWTYNHAIRMTSSSLDVFPYSLMLAGRREGTIYQSLPHVVGGTYFKDVDCQSPTEWLQFASNYEDFAHSYMRADSEGLRWIYLEREKENRQAYTSPASAVERMKDVLAMRHVDGEWTVFRTTPDVRAQTLNTEVRHSSFETDDILPEEVPILECRLTGACRK